MIGAALASALVVALGLTAGFQADAAAARAQQHREQARALAGDDFEYLYDYRCTPQPRKNPALRQAPPAPPPMQVTDNLYYVGGGDVASWALRTSDGIILFDALNDADEARSQIVGGLKTLGLDPHKVKYIVVMHGHGDHFGGAAYLQKTLGAKVWMGGPDWSYAAHYPVNVRLGKVVPGHDHDIVDGEKLTLGDTTISLYLTPGHTPGTVSAIIPTSVHGVPHLFGFWGGTGYPRDADTLATYGDSLERFMRLAKEAGVDGIISNHPNTDDSLERMAAMRADPAIANPYVIGADAAQRFFGVIKECALAGAEHMPAVTE
ncbi:MAG TPA: MBL fold metallo-hydrolase [Sphingomonas sp.]|nr:MBL fold metallo-hydrolase [Sphingomonas sp.]